MIAVVVSLLAAHLAAGGLAVTALLALRNQLPDSFVRFCCGAATIAAALSAYLGPTNLALPRTTIAGAALLWYIWLRWRPPSLLPAIVALVAGLAALASECLDVPSAAKLSWLTGSFGSGFLLGAVSVSMILGHWYLVSPGLSIAPLREGILWYWGSLGARWAHIVLLLFNGGWEQLKVNRWEDIVYSSLGLFFLVRVLTGLAAPLLLAALIWQTVKMRSTQSATGLLYVALIVVLFGELISQFLTVATGLPL